MGFRLLAVSILVGVVCACGWGQVRPGGVITPEVPFHRGVNLTGWFQVGGPRQIQFLDTKTGAPADHPWRMGTAIDGAVAPWNNQWRLVRIPLRKFLDRGSWDNAWFNPQDLFDWSAVDRFEIVSEYHDWVGMQFWFDGLRVTDPPGVR